MLLNGGGVMGARLRRGGAIPIGEIFTFLSGLYFRGKLAYALQFGDPPRGLAGGISSRPIAVWFHRIQI
jgi:hypothetical protein